MNEYELDLIEAKRQHGNARYYLLDRYRNGSPAELTEAVKVCSSTGDKLRELRMAKIKSRLNQICNEND